MEATTTGVNESIIESAAEHLREFCAISSQSGNTAGLRAMAACLAQHLGRFGLRVEIVDEKDANGVAQPVLLARAPEAGAKHLLLIGHTDTVLPAVEPKREGSRMLATGALDMKGGLAMLVGALELLQAEGRSFPRDMLVVLVPDEESESFISGRAVAKWSENARAVLVLEPGNPRERGETLVAGRRGLTEWSLEFTGRAAHSGLAYWSGRSAVAAAAEWTARAQALSSHGAGATVNVGRIVGGSADFVEDLGRNHDMLGTSRQLNVVPDRALVEGEIRFLTPGEGPDVLAALERLATEIAAEREVTAKFRIGIRVSPVDPNGPGAPLVQRAVALAADRGFRLEIEADRGGISFPNFLTDPTKTPVIDGLGPTGDGMHVRGEYLNLESLGHRVVLLADLLAEL